MVVVNDAEELVGKTDVEIVVLSTRPTNQGLLVFARVADEASDPAAAEADRSREHLEPVLAEQGHETGSAEHAQLHELAALLLENLHEVAAPVARRA